MDSKKKDNIFYFCTLIEYISRTSKNHCGDVIKRFTVNDISRQLRLAEVNHCLSFEQVSDELIEEYGITDGDFDIVSECRYTVPTEQSIGRVYQTHVCDVCSDDNVEQTIIDVFSSFISDEISDLNFSVYYCNPDYIRCSYLEGRLLS